jgi:hypothetical protein
VPTKDNKPALSDPSTPPSTHPVALSIDSRRQPCSATPSKIHSGLVTSSRKKHISRTFSQPSGFFLFPLFTAHLHVSAQQRTNISYSISSTKLSRKAQFQAPNPTNGEAIHAMIFSQFNILRTYLTSRHTAEAYQPDIDPDRGEDCCGQGQE